MSSRRKARILAFQAVYAWDASHLPLADLLSFSWVDEEKISKYDEETKTFASLQIAGVIEKAAELDAEISNYLDHWTFERLKRVDVAILRTAAYSLLYQRDIPGQITIDEAIEIAKEFGSDDSYRFINGVLDAVWKNHPQ